MQRYAERMQNKVYCSLHISFCLRQSPFCNFTYLQNLKLNKETHVAYSIPRIPDDWVLINHSNYELPRLVERVQNKVHTAH